MSFKLISDPTFSRTVKIKVPVDGGFEDQSIKATFRVLSAETIEKAELATGQGSTKFLKDVLVKLDDIVGEDGQPVPYSDKLRDQIIQLPYVRRPLHDEFFAGIQGGGGGN